MNIKPKASESSMKLKKANSDPREELIKHYSSKSIAELQLISPKWASGVNADKILVKDYLLETGRFGFFLAECSQILETVRFNEVDCSQIFTGNILNDGRIAGILDRWDNDLYVDPPNIFMKAGSKHIIEFSDGRHRAKLSCLLGFQEIPVVIDLEDVQPISKFMNLKKLSI